MPLTEKLESGEHVKYVQPTAWVHDSNEDDRTDAFYELCTEVEYIQNMASCVDFVDEKTAKKIKVNLNYLIREGLEVVPSDFDDDGNYGSSNLIELWCAVRELKLRALDLCEDDADFETRVNYTEKIKGEGYVMISRFGYFKLVNRSQFSYANFKNVKHAAVV
tara:strand:- start:755 stop:1243 length:489 start_codon:yes stop_codon:yes gene_type:complete